MLNDNINYFKSKVDDLQNMSLNRLSQIQQNLQLRNETCSYNMKVYDLLVASLDIVERALCEYDKRCDSRKGSSFQLLHEYSPEYKHYEQLLSSLKSNPTLLKCFHVFDGPLVTSDVSNPTMAFISISIEDAERLLTSGWGGLTSHSLTVSQSSKLSASIEDALMVVKSSSAASNVFVILQCEFDSSPNIAQNAALSEINGLSLIAICLCCLPSLPGGFNGLCKRIESNLNAAVLPSKGSTNFPVDVLSEFQGKVFPRIHLSFNQMSRGFEY